MWWTPMSKYFDSIPHVVLNGPPLSVIFIKNACDRQRPAGRVKGLTLTKNVVAYDAGGFGQPKVSAGIGIGQLLVIEAHQRQYGGVEIVNWHPILRRVRPNQPLVLKS